MRVGFAANLEKEGIAGYRSELMRLAEEAGCACETFDDAEALRSSEQPPELLVVVGGDGSILRFASASAERGVPILGVNLGRIGFLTEVGRDGFLPALSRIQKGEHRIEERMMLSCRVNGTERANCLNDILVFKRSFSGTVQVHIRCDDRSVGSVFCDGVIASTPTGSTAYNLSAGGPVVTQTLDAIVVTPVCSHTLHMRPAVSSADSVWTFCVRDKGFVAADGIKICQVTAEDCVVVTKSRLRARFVRFGEQNVFELIQQKLS